MECNKEEASRAKVIAEKKLQSKDYLGARKFLLKAQQLYPEIENISQLLSVCDVHSSAESKRFGNEMDWYGILQVEQTADDLLIKKQYRKFALLLHPDKNKFPGAEAAFKLIGEAQRVLLDKEKRSFHDLRRKTSFKHVIPHQPPQSRPQNKFSGNTNSHVKASNPPRQGQTQHAQTANGGQTFWTLCLHCCTKYQYYKDVLGKALRCQNCKKPFVSYDMEAHKFGTTQPGSSQQSAPNKPNSNVGPQAKNAKPTSDSGFQAERKEAFNRSSNARKPNEGPNKMDWQGDEGDEASKHEKTNGRRGKKQVESSESFESDSSQDSEDEEIHAAVDENRETRRSNRNKRRVSYNEKASDDEQVAAPSKKAKENAATGEKVDTSNIFSSTLDEESKKEESNLDTGKETLAGSTTKNLDDEVDSSVELTPESPPTPTFFQYPDAEFCDFDKSKEEHCFKAGQLWAVYDTADAMPRFYAKIKKIYASKFKLQITWLEPNPDDEVGIEWINSDLPLPCGKFKMGETENTEDRLMFSHLVSGLKSTGRSSFVIYPRDGEIWAIYKNWDAMWYLIPENERKFEYEPVEILSDGDVFRVVMLDKVEGFTSVYKPRTSGDSLVTREIPHFEVLRFSHQIPSFRLTNERDGSLKDCFELDLGALPTK